MKQFFRALPSLLKETAGEWQRDNAMRLAAALSYYTVFSLTPLMLAAIAVAGIFFGERAASGKIFEELHTVVGSDVAAAVQEMVKAADKPTAGPVAAAVAFALGLFGASGVFGELMSSLNQIWGAKPPEGGGIWQWIKSRFLSIGMVMGVCFLLLVSLLANALFSVFANYGLSHLPGAEVIGQALGFLLSLGFVTVLFAAMFKFLPRTNIQWHDVWTGAAVTAFLFAVGKFGLEQYLARSNPGSMYGAAGTLVLVLIWVYYSAQIFFFGAEFTEVYARRFGSRFAHPPPAEALKAADEAEAGGGNIPAAMPWPNVHPRPQPQQSTGGSLVKVALVLLAAWVASKDKKARTKRWRHSG